MIRNDDKIYASTSGMIIIHVLVESDPAHEIQIQ